ncbi:MAG TPA: hypothetical protein VNW68_02825 [Candidatus Limnocylindria bacterium]|jgi:hypothetical protein|nr:hypothetical protein [Candidatus Limnocylindria bacterium]
MGRRDRPQREAKKKPKEKQAKHKLESLLDSPPPSVEVIKPRRKPRHEQEEDSEPQPE